MLNLPEPAAANHYYQQHIALLLNSYQQLLKQPLFSGDAPQSLAQQAYEANWVLLSHTAEAEPRFNYANRQAQTLFEYSWDELIGLPSRLSAEPINQQARQQLLETVAAQGYIDNYAGVRIAKSGQRFEIEQAVVWNVSDEQGRYVGQAAYFKDWRLLA